MEEGMTLILTARMARASPEREEIVMVLSFAGVSCLRFRLGGLKRWWLALRRLGMKMVMACAGREGYKGGELGGWERKRLWFAVNWEEGIRKTEGGRG